MDSHAERPAIVNEATDEYMEPTYDTGVTRRVGEQSGSARFDVSYLPLDSKDRFSMNTTAPSTGSADPGRTACVCSSKPRASPNTGCITRSHTADSSELTPPNQGNA